MQRLVEKGSFGYASTKNTLADLDKLGLGFEDVAPFILALSAKDFRGARRYEYKHAPGTYTRWMDVYRFRGFYCPSDDSDEGKREIDLYIKLSQLDDCLMVTVQSFHEWDEQK